MSVKNNKIEFLSKENFMFEKQFKTDDKKTKLRKAIIMLFGGAFVGFVNGFFGAGGGMLLVPLLTYGLGFQEKQSHATAISIILPLSIVSSIVYIENGVVDFKIFAPTLVGVIVGGIIGALFLAKTSNKILSFVFFLVMLVAGIKMVI